MAEIPPTRPVLGVIAVLSLLFNGVLCIVILRKPRMLRSAHNVLIFSLAITDTLTGIFLIISPTYVIGPENISIPGGLAGQLFCRIINRGFFLFLFAKFSVMLVTCMAAERWFAIARPSRYKLLFTRRRVGYYMVGIFVWCALWTCPGLLETPMAVVNAKNKCVFKQLIKDQSLSRSWVIVYGVVTVLVPLLFILGTFLHLRIHVKKMITATGSLTVLQQAETEMKLSRMSAAVGLLMGVCFLPVQTTYTLTKFGVFAFTSPIHLTAICLSMLNSCVNPWIYCLTSATYRKEFASLLCPRQCRKIFGQRLDLPPGKECVSIASFPTNREATQVEKLHSDGYDDDSST